MAEAVPTRAKFAAAYLQHLQELASEMDVAMAAIAGNALNTLEESVARQEMLCASLSSIVRAAGENLYITEDQLLPPGLDPAVAHKIRATSHAIQDLNLQYAALLQHSGKSIALLSALCKNHTGQTQEARGIRSKYQTWSCEM